MNVSGFFKAVKARLTSALGSEGEADAAARIIFEDVAGYDRKYLFINGDREITDFMAGKIDDAVVKVERGEPVQYAVGRARFMGNDYAVTPAVLIPRPETAGLVDAITDAFGTRSDLDVLDIGTGSGCIAIELARALPFSRVTAFDISDAALTVARENARRLGATVNFVHADILTAKAPVAPLYDIIVSNPPYICDSEKADMDARVLDYEPPTALFVPDSDPLRFYRTIAAYARAELRPGGGLFFEINPLYHRQIGQMLTAEGFADVSVTRDYRGLYRYAVARKPSN